MNEICQSRSCEITTCRQRHPYPCKYYTNFRRCKFSPCAFKHENGETVNNDPDIETEMKIISDKIVAIDEIISEKDSKLRKCL